MEAERAIEHSMEVDDPLVREWTSVLSGVIDFRLGRVERAQKTSLECIEAASKKLEQDTSNFDLFDSTALSYCGLSLCGDPNAKMQAIEAFLKSRAIVSASGIVDIVLLVLDALDTERLLPEVRRINRLDPQLQK